jgi:hypothetical protein
VTTAANPLTIRTRQQRRYLMALLGPEALARFDAQHTPLHATDVADHVLDAFNLDGTVADKAAYAGLLEATGGAQ